MRIAKLETLHGGAGWRNFSFLKLTTDEGLIGWSEYNENFGAGGVSELIGRFEPVMDPRAVAKLSASLHALTRMAYGGVSSQAIAAIENACLDVKAKALGVPVYALFGGPCRERIALYWSHCGSFRTWRRDVFEKLGYPPIRTLDDVAALGREVAARGFRNLKTNPMNLKPGQAFDPGFRITPGVLDRHPDPRAIGEMREVIAAFRAGAGPHVGIQFDINFNQRTKGFLRIAKALEEFNLTWLEIDIHDPDALALIRRSSATPIASLETVCGVRGYRPYFERYAVDVAVIDVPWKHDLVTAPPVIENGELVLPAAPGWGAEVNEDAVRAYPPLTPGR